MNTFDSGLAERLWGQICTEAELGLIEEPMLADLFQQSILSRSDLGDALSFLLANKLANSALPGLVLRDSLKAVYCDENVLNCVARDIQAFMERDSACNSAIGVFLFYKGFLAIQGYRAAHRWWSHNQRTLALLLQRAMSLRFAVDIHPAARIGAGIMLDHATGVVIGETAVVEDCVSIMQSVTLGGTGKEAGDRHPKIRKGVLIGAGAKILGNIEVGEGAMVAAASVVLKAVPEHAIVAGVPAEIVGNAKTDEPARAMDHYFDCR